MQVIAQSVRFSQPVATAQCEGKRERGGRDTSDEDGDLKKSNRVGSNGRRYHRDCIVSLLEYRPFTITMFRQSLRTIAKVNRLAGVRTYAEAASSLKLSLAMPHDVCIVFSWIKEHMLSYNRNKCQ